MYYFGMAKLYLGDDEVGCAQKVSLDISYSIAELYCGSSMFPSDVRTHTGKISGSAEFADINAYGIQKLIGGTRTGDSIAITNTSSPATFRMVMELTTDGVTLSITLNQVRSSKFALPFVRDGHLIPNFDFQAEADDSGNVMTLDVGVVS